MNHYYDPFAMLVGQVGTQPQPAYPPQQAMVPMFGQVGQGGIMVPGGATVPPGTLPVPPGSLPPGYFPVPPGGVPPYGPFGPWAGSCFGPPIAPPVPTAAVEAVKRCTDPLGISSNVDGADAIAVGETRDIETEPQNWFCAEDLDIPRTVSAFFLIHSLRFSTCELLQNGAVHADTFASDAIHPCLKTSAICPGQSIRMSVENINPDGVTALHFYGTFFGQTSQACIPCSPYA